MLERVSRVLAFSITMMSLTACGGGAAQKSDAGGDRSDVSSGDVRPGADGGADASGLTACYSACARYVASCGIQDCQIDCDVFYDGHEAAACDREMNAYFSCVTALTTIQCDSDFLSFIDARKCGDQFGAMMLCENTRGADCLASSAFDDSCAVTNKPPHFEFCKADVQAPTGCVAYGGTTGWFCCP